MNLSALWRNLNSQELLSRTIKTRQKKKKSKSCKSNIASNSAKFCEPAFLIAILALVFASWLRILHTDITLSVLCLSDLYLLQNYSVVDNNEVVLNLS